MSEEESREISEMLREENVVELKEEEKVLWPNR